MTKTVKVTVDGQNFGGELFLGLESGEEAGVLVRGGVGG